MATLLGLTMSAHRLSTHAVAKPWGRTDLPAEFAVGSEDRIGEIWFTGPDTLPSQLLVKYLFTSEALSIQVHPNDEQAQAQGKPGGKSECWYVLSALPDAKLGIGLRREISSEKLRASAEDGSIESLIDWKPVRAGSFYYISAGTVHAIGAGLTIIEIQQNNDITYRLFDYGRPRELHLDAGTAVAVPAPYAMADRNLDAEDDGRVIGGDAIPFFLDQLRVEAGQQHAIKGAARWFLPLSGSGQIDGQAWRSGECWLIEQAAVIHVETDMRALVAGLP